MDVSNSGKLKMESKKAMFCVSHCRGHHSARPQNGTDALTFTYVVSSLPKLSSYYFLFVFTQLLFYWYRSRKLYLPSYYVARFRHLVSRTASFSFSNVFFIFLWFAASHFCREICWFRRVAKVLSLIANTLFSCRMLLRIENRRSELASSYYLRSS